MIEVYKDCPLVMNETLSIIPSTCVEIGQTERCQVNSEENESPKFCDILLNENPSSLQIIFVLEIIHIVLLLLTIIYFIIYLKNRDSLTEYIQTLFEKAYIQNSTSYHSIPQQQSHEIDMNDEHLTSLINSNDEENPVIDY